MKILLVAGARPNFMKIAPLYRAFQRHPKLETRIVHTGQHYSSQMSDIFFSQLEIPPPNHQLGIHGGSHAQQTALTMLAFEEVVDAERPDCVVVVGDVNSTLACALVAAKRNIPLAHVEAGLRSGDRTMPEEINRMLTDTLSDFLFVTESAGLDNLAREGLLDRNVHLVGNCMIDTLVHFREKAGRINTLAQLGLEPKSYLLMTLHRPSNVDTLAGLEKMLEIMEGAAQRKTLVFSLHPRTRRHLEQFGLQARLAAIPNLFLLEQQGYLEFINLLENAAAVITDSGGVQDETTFLRVPCLTFRATTERPSTVELGTNILLADLNPRTALHQLDEVLAGRIKPGVIPPFWDGHAAERIAVVLAGGGGC